MNLISESEHEQIIICMTPLLENTHPTQEICDFFSTVINYIKYFINEIYNQITKHTKLKNK